MHALHVALLGPFEVRVDGVPIGPAGSKRRGLLAILALEANTLVPVPRLVDLMWGEDPPPSAVNVVQTYVSAWRRALRAAGVDGALATVGGGYRLELATDRSDLLLARQEVLGARAAEAEGRQDEAVRRYAAALALWRGPALADLGGEPFQSRLAALLDAERMATLESWAAAALRTGADPAPVAERLTGALAADHLRERVAELLMWALTASGRQATALEVYTSIRGHLRRELGSEPGPALAAMQARVLRQDPALLVADGDPAATRTPVRLPSRPGRLVGRDADLATVAALLDEGRLVTLTGPGGCGKTRLASEVAALASERGRVWFVELAALTDSDLAPATIASALEVQTASGGDVLDAVLAHLERRPGLLVLDNLEHLPGVATVVARLLRGTHVMRVLVTSRELLHLDGEQQFRVSLLGVPPATAPVEVADVVAYDAVRLMIDRARADDPSFAVDEVNAAEIASIARALDGLPLALEIVAPWVRLLGTAGLADRLATSSLDVPSRRRDAPARHRTLRDTLTWSFELLPREAQALLLRLTVFSGSFGLDAVDAVCREPGAAPGAWHAPLFDLVDHHLVETLPPVRGLARFRLLETVREFAAAASESDDQRRVELRLRHADWYAAWAVGLAGHSEGPEAPAWLDQAVAEADNLRAAIATYAAAGRSHDRLQLVVDAMVLWFEAGHEQEGEQRMAEALDAAGPGAPARAIGLTYLAWLRSTHDRVGAATDAAEAVRLTRASGDAAVESFALQTLGETLPDRERAIAASEAVFEAAERAEGRPVRYGPTAPDAVRCGASYNLAAQWSYRSVPRALRWQQEALHRAELEGDRRIIAVNAARLALLHLLDGDPPGSRRALERADRLLSTRVTARWEDIVAHARGRLAAEEGRLSDAETEWTALYAVASSQGRPLHTALGAAALADLLIDAARLEEARSCLEDARRRLGRADDRRRTAHLEVCRARLERTGGEPSRAAALLAQVEETLDPDELAPERIGWLLESATIAGLADDGPRCQALVRTLREESARTGVHLSTSERARLAEAEHGRWSDGD